jgi:hypothetical protein
MNALAPIQHEDITSLPALVDRASSALVNARTAAEVLEARDMADFAYDVAKRTARLKKAKGAHDELIAAAHRAQAGALEIEAQAKRRLADEYDAAQQQGEVQRHGGDRTSNLSDGKVAPATSDIGLTYKEIHEARQIRDAEEAEPGIVRRVLDEHLERGDEPTKAALRKVVLEAAMRGLRGGSGRKKPVNPFHEPNPAFDAIALVNGCCTDIAEAFDRLGAQFILSGCVSPDMRESSIERITRGRNVLNLILEAADAQENP